MKTLVELQNEIQSLTAQASELRAKEFGRTLEEIVSNMRAFGITVAQVRDALQAAAKSKSKVKGKRGRKPKASAAATVKAKKAPKAKASAAKSGARKPAPIKFRGPNGEAWSGRGKLPKWLQAAKDSGQSVDSFRV